MRRTAIWTSILTQDEIVDRLISDMEDQIGLTDEPSALRGLIRSHWVNAPAFPDARTFFNRCPVSIYIITNNGLPYMEQALRVSGCTSSEVVHIGDSYDTDVAGARGAGIRPVLLLRGHTRRHDDVDTADDLD